MRFYLAALPALFFLSEGLAADPVSQTITVHGTASVLIAPDMAQVHYGITVTEPSADAVKDALTKMEKGVDEAVKKLKIDNMKISNGATTYSQAAPNENGALAVPAPPGAAAAGQVSYSGHTSHTAVLTDTDPVRLRSSVESLVKTLIEQGVNTNGIEKSLNDNFYPGQEMNKGPKVILSKQNDETSRDEAYEKAVKKALRHAKAMGAGLGMGNLTLQVESVGDGEVDKSNITEFFSPFNVESAKPSPAGMVEVKVRVVLRVKFSQ
jgi:uncharacterized protein YggE